MNPLTSTAMPALSSIGKQMMPDFGAVDSAAPAGGQSFVQSLQTAFESLNNQQNSALSLSKDFATGRTSDIHGVMIASEQATVSLQLATQVRNKVIDAYQEIMRTAM